MNPEVWAGSDLYESKGQDRVMNQTYTPKSLVESLIYIEDKDRRSIPFKLNPIQESIRANTTGRDVFVKPASVGATSYFMQDFLVDCLTIIGTTSVIISYDEFITGRLLRKAQSFYDSLSRAEGLTIPKLFHKSTSEKTYIFEDSRGVKHGESSFYIASAKGFSMPRGEPIHNLLLDEFAFWPSGAAVDVFAAALQRVPLTKQTKVAILSTPNGEENDFYEIYMAAKEGKEVGKSIFKAHFYPWYAHPEYSLPFDSPFVLPGDEKPVLDNLDSDEIKLILRFRLLGIDSIISDNKIRWRRYKIAELSSLRRSGETRLLFGQEYPEDDVSCFQSAGDMVFDSEQLNAMAKDCYPAPIREMFADIWNPPEEGMKYLVAIDPGLGKISESVATVWTFTDTEFLHCATLAGFYGDDEMAEKSQVLARYYNTAIIANEDTLGITSHLKDYPELYYRTDPVTGKVGKDIGWQTTKSTKPYMMTELSRELSKISTHDIRIPSQLRNIRWVGGRAIPIGSDDVAMSTAIAIVCRTAMPIERGFVGSHGWSDSWGRD
jgi:hypothetical protein